MFNTQLTESTAVRELMDVDPTGPCHGRIYQRRAGETEVPTCAEL